MRELEKNFVGFGVIGGAFCVIGGFIGNKPEVAGLGVWMLIIFCIWAARIDAREKKAQRAIEEASHQPDVVARTAPAAVRPNPLHDERGLLTDAGIEALLQEWLSGKPLVERPQPRVVQAAMVHTEARLAVTDRFVLPCVCARTDRGFAVLFERQAGRVFKIAGVATSVSGHGVTLDGRTVPTAALDMTGWVCPFCNALNGFVRCGRCDLPVCEGRVKNSIGGRVFRCRDSCGGSGRIQTTLSAIGGGDGGRDAVLSVRQQGLILRRKG